MRREEKNRQSRARIIDSALNEFSERGYGLSSINTICDGGNISKGILYHYFSDKDELYLACMKACFNQLVTYLQGNGVLENGGVEIRLQEYFDMRLAFFQENPRFQKLFCEALVAPPNHLVREIEEIKADFDTLNVRVLNGILDQVELRPGITKRDVVDILRQYQDFINVQDRRTADGMRMPDIAAREAHCRRAVDILLYGVVERTGAYR